MLVSEIATRVKRQFGDEAGVQIEDADIIRWVNDIQKDIASSQSILETSATTSIVSGTDTYALPTDIQDLVSIWFDGVKLEPMSMREAEETIMNIGNLSTQPTGKSQICWVWAEQLHVWPVPNSNITGGLKVFYSRFPIEVTSINDTPELESKYHNIIVNYCLQKAYELDEDWQASQTKASQVTGDLSSLANDEKWTIKGTYPTITVLQEDM